MVQSILDNGNQDFVMVEEYKYGKMGLTMKDIGKTIKLMEREDLFIQTEIFMRENGKMIKLMVVVFTNIPMALNIEDNGQKTNKKEKGLRPGLMEQDMKETISKAKKMV